MLSLRSKAASGLSVAAARAFAPLRAMTTINYIEPSGEMMAVTCAAPKDKDTVMTVAVENRVDMEAACDGQLSCSTCHVVLDKELYKALEKSHPPTEEELDMLDTAFGLTPTSRLGCQIPVSALPDGVTITIPSTR